MDGLVEIAQKGGDSECFFSVSLQRANIFFKARFIGCDQAGLQFKLPSKVFKVQRRKDLRFPIPDGLALKVDFADPLSPTVRSQRKVIDISASGLAFVIGEDEMPLFPAGLSLSDFTFTVRGRKISVTAEIRHVRKLADGGRLKGAAVGVLFKDIRAGDNQHIALHLGPVNGLQSERLLLQKSQSRELRRPFGL
jgi:hypothetical protein